MDNVMVSFFGIWSRFDNFPSVYSLNPKKFTDFRAIEIISRQRDYISGDYGSKAVKLKIRVVAFQNSQSHDDISHRSWEKRVQRFGFFNKKSTLTRAHFISVLWDWECRIWAFLIARRLVGNHHSIGKPHI